MFIQYKKNNIYLFSHKKIIVKNRFIRKIIFMQKKLKKISV
jgi:hypothetical protein